MACAERQDAERAGQTEAKNGRPGLRQGDAGEAHDRAQQIEISVASLEKRVGRDARK